MSAFARFRRAHDPAHDPLGKTVLGIRPPVFRGHDFLTSDAWFAYGCAIAWLVLLFLYTWMNALPAAWHWDEPSKVQQILTSDWNFNHPQLLLTATKLALALFDPAPTARGILLAGRWCSAIFACTAVVALAVVAKRLCGNLAGWCALIWIGSGAFIFGLAHYFKEDTTLVFGLSVFAIFLIEFERSPATTRAILLGIGAGLAASGKYIGFAVMPIALIAPYLVEQRPHTLRIRQSLVIAAASVATIALVNLPGVTQLLAFSGAMKRELFHVLTEHGGVISPITDTVLVWQVAVCCNVALLAWLAFIAFRREELTHRLSWAAVALVPLLFLALSQLSVIKLERYTLPTIVFIQCLAACGIACLAASGSAVLRGAAVAIFLLGVAWNVSQFATTIDTMRHGSRASIAAWVRSHVPADAVIAESPTVDLNADGAPYPKLRQTIIPIGSFNQMRADGVQYFVISNRAYDRFVKGKLRLAKDASGGSAAEQAADFARVLASSRLLINDRGEGLKGLYFSPRLAVYRFLAPDCPANLC